MRDIPRHSAIADIDMSGIRVRSNKRIVQGSRQVYIRSSDNRNECFHDDG